MTDYNQMLYSMEVHSAEGIQDYFRKGGNPNEGHNGVPLFTTMVEMYTRTRYPISYCMMGLLPQMHRKETTIASSSSLLVKRAYGIEYTPGNVPCAYLSH